MDFRRGHSNGDGSWVPATPAKPIPLRPQLILGGMDFRGIDWGGVSWIEPIGSQVGYIQGNRQVSNGGSDQEVNNWGVRNRGFGHINGGFQSQVLSNEIGEWNNLPFGQLLVLANAQASGASISGQQEERNSRQSSDFLPSLNTWVQNSQHESSLATMLFQKQSATSLLQNQVNAARSNQRGNNDSLLQVPMSNQSQAIYSNQRSIPNHLPQVSQNTRNAIILDQRGNCSHPQQAPQNGFLDPCLQRFDLNAPGTFADSASDGSISFQPLTPHKRRIEQNNQTYPMLNNLLDESHLQENNMLHDGFNHIGEKTVGLHCRDSQFQSSVPSLPTAPELHLHPTKDSNCAPLPSKENSSPEKQENGVGVNTPQLKPKRKKIRPCVVKEGKAKKTPNYTVKQTTPIETKPAKRKYVRKNGTKTLNKPNASAVNEISDANMTHAFMPSKRTLNFNVEGHQDMTQVGHLGDLPSNFDSMSNRVDFNTISEAQVLQLRNRDSSGNKSTVHQALGLEEDNSRAGFAFDLNCAMTQEVVDYIPVPEKPAPSTPNRMKNGPPRENLNDMSRSDVSKAANRSWFQSGSVQTNDCVISVTSNRSTQLTSGSRDNLSCIYHQPLDKGDPRALKRTHSHSHSHEARSINLIRTPLDSIYNEIYNEIQINEHRRESSYFGSQIRENYKKMRTEESQKTVMTNKSTQVTVRREDIGTESRESSAPQGYKDFNFSKVNTAENLRNKASNFIHEKVSPSLTPIKTYYMPSVSTKYLSHQGIPSGVVNDMPICSHRETIPKKRFTEPTHVDDFASLTAVSDCNNVPTPPKNIALSGSLQQCEIFQKSQSYLAAPQDKRKKVQKYNCVSVTGNSKSSSSTNQKWLQENCAAVYSYLHSSPPPPQISQGHLECGTRNLHVDESDLVQTPERHGPKKQKALLERARRFDFVVDEIIHKLCNLNLNDNALVPYNGAGQILPYEGLFDPIKKRKPRAKVDLDPETERVWMLLMGKEGGNGHEGTDAEKEKWWEEERRIFRGRTDSFIARMHLIQALWWSNYGDSALDLQRLAIRVLSATCSAMGCERNWSTFQHVHTKKRNRLEQRLNALVFVKYNMKLKERQKKRDLIGSSYDPICLSDMDSDDEWITEKEDPTLPKGPTWMDVHECFDVGEGSKKRKRGDRRFTKWNGSVVDSVVGVFLTQNVSDHLSSSAYMSLAAHFPLKSRSNSEGYMYEVQEPDACILDSSGSEVPRSQQLETREMGSNESFASNIEVETPGTCRESSKSSGVLSQDSVDSSIGIAERTTSIGNGRHSDEDERGALEDFISSQTSVTSSIDNTDEVVRSCSDSNSEDLSTGCQPNSFDPTYTTLLQMAGTLMFQEYSGQGNINLLADHHSDILCKQSEAKDYGKRESTLGNMQEKGDSAFIYSSISELQLTQLPISPTSDCSLRVTPDPRALEVENTQVIREYDGVSFRSGAEVTQIKDVDNGSGINGPVTETANETSCQRRVVYSCDDLQQQPDGSFTSLGNKPLDPKSFSETLIERKDNGEKPAISKIPNPIEETTDYMGSLLFIDQQKPNEKIVAGANMKDHVSSSGKVIVDTTTNSGKSEPKPEKEKKKEFDWDSLRKEAYQKFGKKDRTGKTMDSVDWEAVRCADVSEIAKTIKERGMNNMLAERIKDFLDRLVRQHESIDLEWLRDVPPDKAKEYLLSIRGLGLKSVECVRLLTLEQLAFPVDTNVGRIAVRLGWVPLQPLPESLQLHLLELYPIQESIQKYLWPRLCTLDQPTLYELHYQLITFGKVFCTKSKPNCNACPMRAECKHFASAFASARLTLPGPEEKGIVEKTIPITSDQNPSVHQNASARTNPMELPPPITNVHEILSDVSAQPIISIAPAPAPVPASASSSPTPNMFSASRSDNIEPIIEVPASPEPEYTEIVETDMEDFFYDDDPDEIPTIELNVEHFATNLQSYMQQNNMELQGNDISQALVALTPEATSIPTPKLKNVSRLRTEHQVYELPDSHPLLIGVEKRVDHEVCSYLLAIWTPGETAESTQPPKRCCSSQTSGNLCDEKTCFSCNSIREANSQTIRGTLLIPCRTAMRGSFPLNGTYFQVNEVFADHDSSLHPIDVPRKWLWNLPRRTVLFGTSVPSIFKAQTTQEIQSCFWRGYVCVRGFDQKTRSPKPLMARLHFPASRLLALQRQKEEQQKQKEMQQKQEMKK